MRYFAILLGCLALVACGGDIGEKHDAGTDAGPSPSADAGDVEGGWSVREEMVFSPLDDGSNLEIVSGFQGGWHVEPFLRIDGLAESELNGEATFWVEQGGNLVADSGQIIFEPLYFQGESGSYYLYTQILFTSANSADEMVGPATVGGEVVLQDGRTLDLSTDVELINEVEEFEF